MDGHKGTCIIHKKSLKIDDDHLISPQSFDSWATLLEAAKIQQHDSLLQIARNTREGEVPEIFYHRKCRSVFTNKRDLESLKENVPWKRNFMKAKPHLKRRGKEVQLPHHLVSTNRNAFSVRDPSM